MEITSAKFIQGVNGTNAILKDGTPQIAFIGRSNAGKSSLINSLTKSPKLAITSDTPGRTREINVFLVNKTHHFLDLPGYGYAKAGSQTIYKLGRLIFWYLFESGTNPTVVMIIDALVGPTVDDLAMLRELEQAEKRILIVLNKVDKIPKSKYHSQLQKLATKLHGHPLFPYSSKTKVGRAELLTALLSD